MCIARNCGKASHVGNKHNVVSDHVEVLFICVPGDTSAVYTKPAVAAHVFGESLERYMRELRSKEGWESFLSVISKAPKVDQTEQSIAEFSMLLQQREDDPDAALTPLKKRAKLDLRPKMLDTGFDITLSVVQENLGKSDSMVLENLRMEWQKLGKNFESIQELLDGTRAAIRSLSEVAQEEFTRSDLDVAKLQQLVGERPLEMGTMSVFDMIGIVQEDLAKVGPLEEYVASHSGEWEASLMQRLENLGKRASGEPSQSWKAEFMNEIKTNVEPLFRLFVKLSSGFATPGDKLETRFSQVQSELAAVKAELNRVQAGEQTTPPRVKTGTSMWGNLDAELRNNPTSSSLGQVPGRDNLMGRNGSTTGEGPRAGTAPGPSNLASRVTALEVSMKALEDQLASTRVDIGGVIFKSRSAVSAWLATNANAPGAYIHFLDAHSLLNVCTDEAGSNAEVLAFQTSSAKSGYINAEEALVVSSFKIELPSFFGWGKFRGSER